MPQHLYLNYMHYCRYTLVGNQMQQLRVGGASVIIPDPDSGPAQA